MTEESSSKSTTSTPLEAPVEPVQPKEQTPKTTTKPAWRSAILLTLGALLLVAMGVGGTLVYQYLENRQEPSVATRNVPASDGNTLRTDEETTVSTVAEKVSPSVVSIVTETQATSSSIWGRQEVQQGAGSGIIVSADGYILTNKHVIKGARSVEVVLSDGTSYSDVKIVGSDPMNDVAFLKIADAKDLPVAELGDSTTVKIGQHVIAIGNSLGEYQNTVTSGIISGKGRPLSAQSGDSVESLTDLLQTDAAINPGNSGGPLLNAAGQVIGINTAIAEDAEGIGFAIPINAVKGTLKGVLAGKTVERSYLGVRYVAIDAAVAKRYNLPVKTGAYVYSDTSEAAVVAGSPADKAGIKKGDIIVKINDVEVGARGGVASLIAEYAPGDTVELTINRGGSERVVKVVLGTYTTN